MQAESPTSASYRALFGVRGVRRLVANSVLARLGGQMWTVGMVLFVLQVFHSPSLAGLTIFVNVLPGLLLSPITGALLDRHGRVRLMLLDLTVGTLTLLVIVGLAASGRLWPPLLLALVLVGSLTFTFSATGPRSLFPLIVPRQMWDRVNAVDSGMYALTAVLGPALAGGLVALFSAWAALLVTSATWALAAVALMGIPDPIGANAASRSIWRDAWEGVRYVIRRNATLRGLALAISLSNAGFGILAVALPVLVLSRLHGNAAQVGQSWAALGVASLVTALLVGRMNSEGREKLMLAAGMLVPAIAFVVMAYTNSLAVVMVAMLAIGLANGPLDIALFSIRQRRTDPAWFGRAFAVSMSVNYVGVPVGAAISGPLIGVSLRAAFLLAALIAALAAVSAVVAIPSQHQ
jgi:MFS family permease